MFFAPDNPEKIEIMLSIRIETACDLHRERVAKFQRAASVHRCRLRHVSIGESVTFAEIHFSGHVKCKRSVFTKSMKLFNG